MRGHMFKFILPFLFMTASSAQAYFVTITQCQSASKTHSLKMEQAGDDVVINLDNLKATSWGRLKKYKVSGQTLTTLRVQKVSLAELRNLKEVVDLIASIMYSRSEFDGEFDLVHGYAHDLVYELDCR